MSRLVDEGSPLSEAWRPFEPCAESAKRAAYEKSVEEGACPCCEQTGDCASGCYNAGVPRKTLTKEARARLDGIVDDYRTGKRGPTADELARWHRDGR